MEGIIVKPTESNIVEFIALSNSQIEISKSIQNHQKQLEILDGRGYPRSLTKEDLSVPSRILAIADIFEALTASDRPYKKSKTLSEALTIMQKMKQERHIDADLFNLFITSGVYKTYAKSYLNPEQIDKVDEEALLK